MALPRLLAKVAKKGRLQRPLGGKIAPKPDKVTVCLATPLHNFPARESFLLGRHFFMVPPGAALPCASAAVRRAKWISSSASSCWILHFPGIHRVSDAIMTQRSCCDLACQPGCPYLVKWRPEVSSCNKHGPDRCKCIWIL